MEPTRRRSPGIGMAIAAGIVLVIAAVLLSRAGDNSGQNNNNQGANPPSASGETCQQVVSEFQNRGVDVSGINCANTSAASARTTLQAAQQQLQTQISNLQTQITTVKSTLDQQEVDYSGVTAPPEQTNLANYARALQEYLTDLQELVEDSA